MIKCNFTKEENLSAYVDGELEHEEMQSIANHIKECEECKAFVAEIEELSDNTFFHYEQIEKNIEFPDLMADLNEKLKDLDKVTNDNIIEFPGVKREVAGSVTEEDRIFTKIYKFAPALISLAAIFLISFGIMTNKPSVTTINTQAKTSDGVTIDSLEYNKFNTMIYKTKEKNKTVIWSFEENNDEDNGDGPI